LDFQLEETAGRVFIHESYVNDMYAFTRGRPIHPDNMFVYNGYKGALLNLLKVLSQPDSQLAARAQIYQQTVSLYLVCVQWSALTVLLQQHGYLHSILTVVHARCVDQLQAKLLKDPEFARLLVYLVGVL
jgi:hypothetical protein